MRTKLSIAFLMVVGATVPVTLWGAQSVSAAGKLSPSERRCFEVFGGAGGAALVNLTPVLAEGAGDGKLVASDVTNPPTASNVNFRPGTIDPNVAITPIGGDSEVCFVNSVHTNVHLVADHLGTIAASAYTPATASGAPDRRVDTRKGIGGGKVPPSGRRCFTVNGDPGDAAVVNLTPLLASGAGDGQLVSSDVATPPKASNVNFSPGSVDPNVAIAEIGTDGQVCFVNSVHASVHLVADHLGTISASAYTAATSSGAPDRRVDTRIGLGGDKFGPSGRRCFSVAGNPGDAAVVNLTPVLAEGAGDGQLVSSDVTAAPKASNVNFRPGSIDPNVAIAPIGADGMVCYVNSTHTNVHLVADHLGSIAKAAYTPATESGAPVRAADTRKEAAELVKPMYESGNVRFELQPDWILMECVQRWDDVAEPYTAVLFHLKGFRYEQGERAVGVHFVMVDPPNHHPKANYDITPTNEVVVGAGIVEVVSPVQIRDIVFDVWDERGDHVFQTRYQYEQPLPCAKQF